MCGLIGIYFKSASVLTPALVHATQATAQAMLTTLEKRGPDEMHLRHLGQAFLGHTRLSIIDLSTGSQPIMNEDGTVAVVLNGEIYNFLDLRADLEQKGHRFRSHSDTEGIVHLYEEVGEQVFSHLNGMFAILIYDIRKNIFLAARDRTGEKPLLYCETKNKMIFASELKAILEDPDVEKVIQNESLALYFNMLCVPAPLTIFKGVSKLPPASYMKVEEGFPRIMRYWEPRLAVNWRMCEHDITAEFNQLFTDAVRRRTISDVPIGVFLSGGIDSSAVVAFMAQNCPGEVQSFCVGFGDEIDERPYARMVAERYRTKHTELFVDEKIEDVILDILGYYDEPFGDSSAIPTHLIAREARRHVKVILTGDGGDELFAGYGSYIDQKYLLGNRYVSRIFREGGRLASSAGLLHLFERLYPRTSGQLAVNHWRLVRGFYSYDEVEDLLSIPQRYVPEFFDRHQLLNLGETDALSSAYTHDMNYYLPDDLLKKVDMASMSASLECRAPFLDHRLIEFAFTIPPQRKVRNDQLKYVLKSALKDYLPQEILHRPKTGFGAPVEAWMRKQLRTMVQDHLLTGCKLEALISRRHIDKIMRDVYTVPKCADYRVPYKLWLLFVLEVWMRKYY